MNRHPRVAVRSSSELIAIQKSQTHREDSGESAVAREQAIVNELKRRGIHSRYIDDLAKTASTLPSNVTMSA